MADANSAPASMTAGVRPSRCGETSLGGSVSHAGCGSAHACLLAILCAAGRFAATSPCGGKAIRAVEGAGPYGKTGGCEMSRREREGREKSFDSPQGLAQDDRIGRDAGRALPPGVRTGRLPRRGRQGRAADSRPYGGDGAKKETRREGDKPCPLPVGSLLYISLPENAFRSVSSH